MPAQAGRRIGGGAIGKARVIMVAVDLCSRGDGVLLQRGARDHRLKAGTRREGAGKSAVKQRAVDIVRIQLGTVIAVVQKLLDIIGRIGRGSENRAGFDIH